MHDVAVIGGGPAGATVAALLARRGHDVVLLEKERFPRFHIGESLLPCSMPVFDALGIRGELDARFLAKHAVEFITADASLKRRYKFSEGLVDGPPTAYEVDRSKFDELLLEAAGAAGVDVRQGVTAREVDVDDPEAAKVRVGNGETVDARVLVDATGQRSLIATRRRLRRMDDTVKNFAVFTHYLGAARASGDAEGDITIVLTPEGWWWVIPLAGDRTSVGFTAPTAALGGERPGEAYLERKIAEAPYLAGRLEGASRVEPVRSASDYSYASTDLVGPNWLLCGDAAGFIDPVFSSGVYLALSSATAATTAVHEALTDPPSARRAFARYAAAVRRELAVYRRVVRGWYRPEFVEIMMHPSDRFELRQAVTSLLSGHTASFAVAWRIWLFRRVVWLNRYFRLTPRLPGRREWVEQLARAGG